MIKNDNDNLRMIISKIDSLQTITAKNCTFSL